MTTIRMIVTNELLGHTVELYTGLNMLETYFIANTDQLLEIVNDWMPNAHIQDTTQYNRTSKRHYLLTTQIQD